MKDIIPVDYLRECLNYCPISGSFLKYGFHSNHGRDGGVIVRMEVGLRC